MGSVEYYRDTRNSSRTHFWKLVDGRDFTLRGGDGKPVDMHKFGPSWWRLTGELGIDRIEARDLPPDAPREED